MTPIDFEKLTTEDLDRLSERLLSPERRAEAEQRARIAEWQNNRVELRRKRDAILLDRKSTLPKLEQRADAATKNLQAARDALATAERENAVAPGTLAEYVDNTNKQLWPIEGELQRLSDPCLRELWKRIDDYSGWAHSHQRGTRIMDPLTRERLKIAGRAQKGYEELRVSSLPAADLLAAAARISEQLEEENDALNARVTAEREESERQRAAEANARRPFAALLGRIRDQ